MTALELGAQLPSWHWDLDVGELRDWAQGVEAIGLEWIGTADHVVYAYQQPNRATGAYSGDTIQHESLMVLSFIAACTARLVLAPSVLVLPQREPVLVAKQVAELDVLSGGRVRLGVGVGWQESEFMALGANFHDRGRRASEAIDVLRACWTQEPVNFSGRYTTIDAMSMLPKPVTPGGPPIMLGGTSAPALARAARLGDGWMLTQRAFDPDGAAPLVDALRRQLDSQKRDIASFPMQVTVPLRDDVELMATAFRSYRDDGFTRIGVHLPNFERDGKVEVDEHLRQIEVIAREVWPAITGER
jgi:probable F420-dependent oxidoreductase